MVENSGLNAPWILTKSLDSGHQTPSNPAFFNQNIWEVAEIECRGLFFLPVEDVLGGGVLLQLLHRGQAIVGGRPAAVTLTESWRERLIFPLCFILRMTLAENV